MSFHKNPWLDQHWHEHQRNILEYLPILNLKDVAITCLCKYTLLFGISILWWSLFGSAQIVVRMAKLCKTNKDLWTLCWFWWSAETVRWPKRKVLIFWCPKRARWKNCASIWFYKESRLVSHYTECCFAASKLLVHIGLWREPNMK